MFLETKSSSLTSGEKRKKYNEEDVKNVLEELWDCKLGETFHKIESRIAKRDIDTLLTISRDELLNLTCKEDNGSLYHIVSNEARKKKHDAQPWA